jgi:ribosomal protein S18 acetylase RimI-like enzyme
MPLVRYVLSAAFSRPEAATADVGTDITPADPDRDADRIRSLVEQARTDAIPNGPRLSVAGFPGELRSRPGRLVSTWLARHSGDSHDGCLGLITLVVATSATGLRFSISWLLVGPRARRLGIGTLLVDHALAAAAELGAKQVFVETRSDWPAARAFWSAIASRS